MEAEVGSKAVAATREEVDARYREHRARVGRPRKAVEGQIRTFLESERTRGLREG